MGSFTTITKRTATADILLVEPGWIEQCYLTEAQFSLQAVVENQQIIDSLAAGLPHVQMNVFPAGMQVSLPLMDRDHYRERREGNTLRALAVVTDSEEMRTATKVYFFYHMQLFPVEIFEEEHDARLWLRARQKELEPGDRSKPTAQGRSLPPRPC